MSAAAPSELARKYSLMTPTPHPYVSPGVDDTECTRTFPSPISAPPPAPAASDVLAATPGRPDKVARADRDD